MAHEHLSSASAAAAYQTVALTQLRHAFDSVDFDLEAVLTSDERVGEQLDDVDAQMAQVSARLRQLGLVLPDVVTPDNDVEQTAPLTTGEGRQTPIVRSEEDFQRLVTLAQSHLDVMGIDTTRDPLLQVLPTAQVSSALRDYGDEYGDVSWTKADWAVAIAAGAIGTLLDIVLVRVPQDVTFLRKQQTGSPLTKWMQDDDRASRIHNQFFKRFEKMAKVPYDAPHTAATGGAVWGMGPKTHRLQSFGHDPVLGFLVGIADVMHGSGTYVDKLGNLVRVATDRDPVGLTAAFVTQVRHILSDWYTPAGIPPPLFSLLQLGDLESPFALRPSGENVSWTNVARHMYTHGYDVRHFFTMGIVPGSIEMIVRGYWLLDGLATGKSAEQLKRERVKLASMLLFAHTIATSGTLVKTGLIFGMNPAALNYAQILAMGPAITTWIKEAVARELRIGSALEAEWRAILQDSVPPITDAGS